MLSRARIVGGFVVLAGVISLILSPFIGAFVFTNLWGVEPLAYIGAILLIVGLGVVALSYVIPAVIAGKRTQSGIDDGAVRQWDQVTNNILSYSITILEGR